MDLTASVRFLDEVPDENLTALYRGAVTFVLLSHYEGFGLPVLEAMASGVPVVAAQATALTEVVGDAGLLVPADDPDLTVAELLRVIPGGDMRQACLEKGLARARSFSWERAAAATLQVYREVHTE